MRFLSLVLIAFALNSPLFAQVPRNPFPFDAFGQVPDAEANARIRHLGSIMQDVADEAEILIGAPPFDQFRRYLNERRVTTILSEMKIDPSRVTIRFVNMPDFEVKIWLRPANKNRPSAGGNWMFTGNFRLKKQANPVLVESSRPGASVYEYKYDLAYFAWFMIANPTFTGKVYVFERTKSGFEKVRKRIGEEFEKKYQLGAVRFEYEQKPEGGGGVELWLFPPMRALPKSKP